MKGNEVVGIDMDIAKAIADELGQELEIKNMDFDGALAAVQQGKVDMVAAGVSIDEERAEVMDFSHEYVSSTEVVVVNKENPAVSSVENLNDKVIAVQQGNIADIWVSNKENCQAKEVKRYTKFAQAAEDLVAANPELSVLDGTLFEDKYAIAVKKGNQELLDKINPVIDKLIEEGKIEEFTAKHASSN